MNIQKFLKAHPMFTHAEDIQTICQPLAKLGIVYFSHVRIDAKKRFSAACNYPEFAEFYIKKRYFQYDLHRVMPQNEESLILWDAISLKSTSLEMHADFKEYDRGHTFSIIHNDKENIDCYHFAAEYANSAINQQYLQNIPQLKKFISFYKEQVSRDKGLRSIHDRKLTLLDSEGGYFTEAPLQIPDTENFLNSVKQKRLYVKGSPHYLTPSENACLDCFAKGNTIEETALLLKITPRTVKAHIKNVKEKFGVDNLFQLGMLYQNKL